jgi:hypothetical protein
MSLRIAPPWTGLPRVTYSGSKTHGPSAYESTGAAWRDVTLLASGNTLRQARLEAAVGMSEGCACAYDH